MQTPSPFLEDWLRLEAGGAAAAAPPSSARQILQSWQTLRDPTTAPNDRHVALQTLTNSQQTLHVADPQAKLLLSLLPSSPPPSLSLLFRLLSIWARKSIRPSLSLLESAVASLSPHLSCSEELPFPVFGLLLSGLISARHARRLLRDLPISGGVPEDLIPEFLAGIGYVVAAGEGDCIPEVTGALFRFWSAAPSRNLNHGLMILALFEWLTSKFINAGSLDKVELLAGGVTGPAFAAVSAAAGILRALRRSNSSKMTLRETAEEVIAATAETGENDPVFLKCFAIGLARCGPISPRPVIVRTLCRAALSVVFAPLFIVGDSVLVKESGAVAGVLCSLYSSADKDTKDETELLIWNHCKRFYVEFRSAALKLKGKDWGKDVEEVAEGFFLFVVLFAVEAMKRTGSLGLRGVDVLSSFSCVEYLRRVRLTEYTDVVRRAVVAVQDDSDACVAFVDSMPCYAELTHPPADFPEGARYSWADDEMLTARILFYLRVIPTCISRIPGPIFGKALAPTIFLYLHHNQEKVARSAHSVFAAFVTSGVDSDEDDSLSLKEKLVFYYMDRSLEAYPGRTPFEGMASGVVALARHLPAGSPAMFFCIRSLVEKAAGLCARAMAEEDDLWKNWQDDAQPCRNLSDLLLRLITIVDIQVLPYLLKQLAWFTGQLPSEGQSVIIGELHGLIADSDDVTRKPTLVSWVQSLSYLSSKNINVVHPRL